MSTVASACPFGDDIAVCHEIFRDLHAVRHGDLHAVPAGERARARDGGVNVAALHGDGFRRARVLLLLTGESIAEAPPSKWRRPTSTAAMMIFFVLFRFASMSASVMQRVDGLHLRGLVCRIQPEDHADGKAEDRRERNNAAAERKLHTGVRRDGRAAAGCTTKEKFR